jgi:antitoxin (DNA-binding transcriptional repressor) of toxin-antitoxin stability system
MFPPVIIGLTSSLLMATPASMRTATITEAKNGLSALIDTVRSGETVLILERGIAVARLEPVLSQQDATGRVERLQRSGLVRPPISEPPLDVLRIAPPPLRRGASALEALLDERLSGR